MPKSVADIRKEKAAEQKAEKARQRAHADRMLKQRLALDEQINSRAPEEDKVIIATNEVVPNTAEVARRMRQRAKTVSSKERFIVWKMWSDTIFSFFRADRGLIPTDIGDRLFIGNNVYVTQESMTAVVQITEFSNKLPMAFSSELINAVKEKVPESFIDIQFKNQLFSADLSREGGYESRKQYWEKTIEMGDEAKADERERAVRLLYSYEVLRTGIRAYKTMCFIYLRGKSSAVTKRAVKACLGFLRMYDCEGVQIKTKLPLLMPFLLQTSRTYSPLVKSIPRSMTTSATLSQSLPVTQGVNADNGMLLGIDNSNGSPYYKEFRATKKAKAVYVVGPSGSGKTFLVQNWVLNGFMDGYGASIMDIKGEDFGPLVRACGGTVISLRPGSTAFVNRFKMKFADAVLRQQQPEMYYDSNIAFSKELLTIIADPPREHRVEVSGFLDEFLHSMYLLLGVERSNTNTWRRSECLSVAKVYEMFLNYLSADVKSVYAPVIKQLQMAFNEFLSKGGGESHIFEHEYEVRDCLDSDIISFDYGMLDGVRLPNPVTFKLRSMFMESINDDYISHRWRNGLWTLLIQEESQIADEFLKKLYTKALTLRRAQNCVIFLLGNSAAALAEDPATKAMFSNITMFCIGNVTKTDRQILIQEFNLDIYEEILQKLATSIEYEYRFLFVDRTSKSTSPLLSVEVPLSVRNGPLFSNDKKWEGKK